MLFSKTAWIRVNTNGNNDTAILKKACLND